MAEKVEHIHHHVDPMRYPKVQKGYEGRAKRMFSGTRLFGDLVETMVEIQKGKHRNAV